MAGTNLFAGTREGSVYRSTDDGTTWRPARSGLPEAAVETLLLSGTDVFAGVTSKGIFRSTDEGTSWTAVSSDLTSTAVYSLVVDGVNVFAGGWGGVIRSTDGGTTWTAPNAALMNGGVRSLWISGMNLFAGTHSGTVLLSKDNGETWIDVGSGLKGVSVGAFAVSGTKLFAGTGYNFMEHWGAGVWRCPLSEMTTSIRMATSKLPNGVLLHQNYPNPFNPSTTIRYELSKSSTVRLGVYDLFGREVATLVNERKDAGIHEVKVDGSGLSSGVYFYRLHAGDFLASKRLLLLR